MNRRAKVRLNPDMLRDLLRLPDGVNVWGAQATNDPVGIWVLLGGPPLPEVAPDSEAPIIQMTWERVIVSEETGDSYLRVREMWLDDELLIPSDGEAEATTIRGSIRCDHSADGLHEVDVIGPGTFCVYCKMSLVLVGLEKMTDGS